MSRESEGNLSIGPCYNYSYGSSYTCPFLTAKLPRDDQIHILKQHRRKELETRQKQYRWVMTSDQHDMGPQFLLSQGYGMKQTLPIAYGPSLLVSDEQAPAPCGPQAPPDHPSKQIW